MGLYVAVLQQPSEVCQGLPKGKQRQAAFFHDAMVLSTSGKHSGPIA